MKTKGLRLFGALLVGLSLPVVALAAAPQDDEVVRAGPRPVDEFHPDRRGTEPKAQPEPAYGGQLKIHLSLMPKGLNRTVENSAPTRDIHHTAHESLLRQDWESWELMPNLASSYVTEDLVALEPEAAARYRTRPSADGAAPLATDVRVRVPKAELAALPEGTPNTREVSALFGKAERTDGGWRIAPVSTGNPLLEPIVVPDADVLQVELASVFTFHLRQDVFWHPTEGFPKHRFDAHDVVFSWGAFHNPHVDCDEVRFQFVKITRGDAIDEHTVRFFYESQYYAALESVAIDLMMLPSHIYDLADRDNPRYSEATAPGGAAHDTDAFALSQGTWINTSPYNAEKFVGLGPYRVTSYDQQAIELSRFDDYFDPSRAGYFDSIRWRLINDDSTSWTALLNGELDYFERVKSEYYFGSETNSPNFTNKFYKGYFYPATYGFTCWNLYRPELAEVEVRRALAMAFDGDAYKKNVYSGRAHRVTGPFPYGSPAYDTSVVPLPYDPEEASLILEEAGWYDRNGNGIIDKNGVELQLDFLMPSGNEASRTLGLTLQESYQAIGVKVDFVELEWATFIQRLNDRDFDGGNLAWVPSLESDPEQIWHSRWGAREVTGSNVSGVMDAEVDRLIEAGQRELDKDARQAIWRQLHRRVYELMPYLFGFNVPKKFAMNKNIRGFQSFAIRPGWDVRRWHYTVGTPGTRSTLKQPSAPGR